MAGFFGLFGSKEGVAASEERGEITQENQRRARRMIEKELLRQLSGALGVTEDAVEKTHAFYSFVETLVGYATHGMALSISQALSPYGITMEAVWEREQRKLKYIYVDPSIVDAALAWEELPDHLIQASGSGVDVSEEKIAIVQRYIKAIADPIANG